MIVPFLGGGSAAVQFIGEAVTVGVGTVDYAGA